MDNFVKCLKSNTKLTGSNYESTRDYRIKDKAKKRSENTGI